MKMPTTTKLTLKKIVENLEKIPTDGFAEEQKKLTPEEKQQLIEMATQFEKMGEAFRHEREILESTKNLEKLCTLAEQYAVNECQDCFQSNIVQKDMANLRKRVTEHTKIAKECYAKMQQLNVSHSDMKHILERYYNLKELAESFDPSHHDNIEPLQEKKGNFKTCSQCGKLIYKDEPCMNCKSNKDEERRRKEQESD